MPASAAITTTQDPAAGTVGETFKDEAKLSGLFCAHPTGTIRYMLSSPTRRSSDLGGLVASDGPVSVSGDGEYATPQGASPTQAGTYYWVAAYSGDSNNKEAKSGCADHPAVIDQPSQAITTTQHPAAGTVGETFKDEAKLSGLFGAPPTGPIRLKLSSNNGCYAPDYTTLSRSGPVSVSGDGEYATPQGASPTQAGTYYWVAAYSGDSNNKEAKSGCADEPVRSEERRVGNTTSQDPAAGTVGETVKDEAKLSGLFGAHPTGTISWKLYPNKGCEAPEGGVLAPVRPVSVSGDGEYATPQGASPTQAGTYYWVAAYSGDSNNKEAKSGCADEPVVIGQASPAITTTQDPAAGTVGETFKDEAKLSGLFGAHPTGTISWKLYSNKSCDASEGGLVASDGPVSVSGDGEYATPQGASPTQAGTYYWVAAYSGDSNNKEAKSGCADEPVVIGQASPAITTTQDPAAGTVGETFQDEVPPRRSSDLHPTGTISWKLYSNKSCEASEGGLVASDGPVSVSGDGEYATPQGASPTQAGTYYWEIGRASCRDSE